MSLSQFREMLECLCWNCVYKKDKNCYGWPYIQCTALYTATGVTRMAENSVRNVVILFYFFKYYSILSAPG